jgi:hypothetical protein
MQGAHARLPLNPSSPLRGEGGQTRRDVPHFNAPRPRSRNNWDASLAISDFLPAEALSGAKDAKFLKRVRVGCRRGKKGHMKQIIIALFAAAAFVGCDQQKAEIERSKEAQQKELDRQKDAMGAAAKDAKKDVEVGKDAAQAQIDAEKKKAEAQAEAEKDKVDAQKK